MTRRLAGRATPPWAAAAVLVAGVVTALVVDGLWRARHQQATQLRDEEVVSAVAAHLTERVAATDRAAAALRRVALGDAEPAAPALRDAMTRAVLDQAPAWIEGVALVDPVSLQPTAASFRQPALRSRLSDPDTLDAIREVAQHRRASPALLEDGRLLFALSAVELGVVRAVALALAQRSEVFDPRVAAAVTVHDGSGARLYDTTGGLTDDELGMGFRRTVRRGEAPWVAEIRAPRREDDLLRLLALVFGGLATLAATVGVAQSAIRRRRAQESSRVYRTLFEEAADFVMVLDEKLRVVRANRDAELVLGIVDERDYPRSLVDALERDQQEGAREQLEAALAGQPTEFTARLTARPDQFHRFRNVPLLMEDALWGVQVLVEDVSEAQRLQEALAARQRQLEELNDELYRSSITDPLTKVFNRRHLTDRATEEVARALRYGHQLSCLFLDLDHFKRINDTYGHGIGDEVLKRFAEILQRNLRTSDLVGRYGGEEFVVLLTDTAAEDVVAVAEKLLGLVRRARYRGVPSHHPVTVSIGAASIDRGGPQTVDELFQAADQALYRAKDSGRDRLVLHDSVDPQELALLGPITDRMGRGAEARRH